MKIKLIIILTIFLLFLPSISFSESNPPSPSPAKTSNEPKQRTDTTPQKSNMISNSPNKVPSIIKLPIPPQAYIKTSEKSNKIDNESSDERWLIVFTAALVVVGVLQWLTYRSQTRQLKQTNDLMKDTAERQLRAYIGVPGGAIKLLKNPAGVKAHVMVNSKNAGQTPAYNVRSWITLQVAAYPFNKTLFQPPPDAKYPISILSPGSEHSLFSDVTITSEQLPLLGTIQATIYVYGEILYKDVFGKEWFTKYRFLYGGDEGTQGNRLRIDIEGNEAN